MEKFRFFDLMLLLFLLVLPSEMLVQVGANECEYKSSTFKRFCFKSEHCNEVCQEEGFDLGECKGLLLRCMCTKSCGQPVASPPYPEVPPPLYINVPPRPPSLNVQFPPPSTDEVGPLPSYKGGSGNREDSRSETMESLSN